MLGALGTRRGPLRSTDPVGIYPYYAAVTNREMINPQEPRGNPLKYGRTRQPDECSLKAKKFYSSLVTLVRS